MKNESVDLYLKDGCGRCSYYKSPKCKVFKWIDELVQLRRILLKCGLKEDFKWSQPTYTYNGKNISMFAALKKYAALSFFKGVLLIDEQKLLIAADKNSQAYRQMRFTSVVDILKVESTIKSCIFEAIEIEKTGLKVEYKQRNEPVPEELDQNDELKSYTERGVRITYPRKTKRIYFIFLPG